MKKSFKIAKMNIENMIWDIGVFYSIVIIAIANLSILTVKFGGSTSGLEFATMIFLFVCGLNSFKENFYFAQGNNISRKCFITGVITAIFPIAIFMAIIDISINRVMNLFTVSPTLYDLFYSTTKPLTFDVIKNGWIQSNSTETLINTVLLAAIMYVLSYVLGLVINMVYYRSNVFVKILISLVPPVLIFSAGIIGDGTGYYFLEFIKEIFGINNGNSSLALLSFVVLVIILGCTSKILINEATIKER